LVGLNHFTVPLAILNSDVDVRRYRQRAKMPTAAAVCTKSLLAWVDEVID
jgi:hypothetical protein